MALQITCIVKYPTHEDRHRRIQSVGGASFRHSEDEAIRNVERDPNYYYVSEQGKSVWVIVRQHDGRKYLKLRMTAFCRTTC